MFKTLSNPTKLFLWGHRGTRVGAPENTLPAFLLAYRQHLDGLELDVQLTADGVVVVMHDADLRRTTDQSGPVRSYAWSTLKKFRTKYSDGRVSTIPIPRLQDVLENLPEDTIFCIEFKSWDLDGPLLIRKTLEIVKHYHAETRVMVSSFYPEALKESAKWAPDIPRALAWSLLTPMDPDIIDQSRASWVHVHKDTALPQLQAIHAGGWQVAVWGLESAADMASVSFAEIDAIFLDDPQWAEMIPRLHQEES
ncbi:MAG: glycerophosphodiester phosphodiesterase [Firmicutes bacterium]|nr:glycerophosphodiester phosphodiesterase [Bacillota bacterium]